MRDHQWEYKLVILKPDGMGFSAGKNNKKSEDHLNQLGKLGWELVAVRDNAAGYPVAYLKR